MKKKEKKEREVLIPFDVRNMDDFVRCLFYKKKSEDLAKEVEKQKNLINKYINHNRHLEELLTKNKPRLGKFLVYKENLKKAETKIHSQKLKINILEKRINGLKKELKL